MYCLRDGSRVFWGAFYLDGNGVKLVQRELDKGVYEDALSQGYSMIQARILAGRLPAPLGSAIGRIVRPKSSDLDSFHLLPDIHVAASCVADAVCTGAPIAIVTDHDADGATAHAIIRGALEAWGVPPQRLKGYLSHRLQEGYGVSDALVDRMLPDLEGGTCIITADQGSTDELRIARLRAEGHYVVVTDHHGIPASGPPTSANAVVNPVRGDSRFPDRAIAGCHTALLVMARTREELIDRGFIGPAARKMSSFLDLCAVGTIADAASLGTSVNNRGVVQLGLALMNGQPRPCWRAMRRLIGKIGEWTANDIAFQLATRINARGRVDDAMLSVKFLLADDEDEAFRIAKQLDESNLARRALERENTRAALEAAGFEVAAGRYGLCLWLGEVGHPGVHGISASRVVERFGRPTICLSPVRGDTSQVTGSIRTTSRVHVADALSALRTRCPSLLLSSGGHAGAGGLRILRSNRDVLADEWDRIVRERYDGERPMPEVYLDGELGAPSIEDFENLRALEPYGRGFEPPVFSANLLVESVREIGDGTHLKLSVSSEDRLYDAVWFSAKEVGAALPVSKAERIRAAYSLDVNEFRGARRLQLQIKAIERVQAR